MGPLQRSLKGQDGMQAQVRALHGSRALHIHTACPAPEQGLIGTAETAWKPAWKPSVQELKADGAEIPEACLPLHTVSQETPPPGCGGVLVLTLGGAWGGADGGPGPPPAEPGPV